MILLVWNVVGKVWQRGVKLFICFLYFVSLNLRPTGVSLPQNFLILKKKKNEFQRLTADFPFD